MSDRHEEESKKIHIRLRCVIIHEDKLLATYIKTSNHYFFPGGHMEVGENVIEGCQREIKEELGEDVEFEFKKLLYIREYIERDKNNKQNLELFILGNVNKFEELEGKIDPEHSDGSLWTTWLDLNNLPENIFPQLLAKRIAEEYKKDFPSQGEYVGVI